MITKETSVDTLLNLAIASLNELLKEDIDGELDNDMKSNPIYNDWNEEEKMNEKGAIKSVMRRETFTVRDLFRGIEWNRIPLGKRIQLGSRFYNEYKNGDKGIKPYNKTTLKQQIYIKV